MTPQKQRFRHRPERGEYGDCHRTAIACMLDIDRDAVPNFGVHDDPKTFYSEVDAFLSARGFATIETVFDCAFERIMECQEAVNPHVYYLLAGTSRTGVNHTVVACGGEIVWDPSLDDAGIVGPCDDGYFWVTYLVPLAFTRSATSKEAK